MQKINSDAKESIVVLGSKPDSRLPAVAAPYVYGANGAVEMGLLYRKRYGSKIVGVVPSVELRKHTHIQDSFKSAQPDSIIIFGGDPEIFSFIREDLELTEVEIIVIDNAERLSLMRTALGWRILLVIWERIKIRGFRHCLRKVVPDILLGREKGWLMHSTGLDTIMLVMQTYPNVEVITAGIAPIGCQHFNKKGFFMHKTAADDRGSFKHWPKKLRPQVSTTDTVLSELCNFPMWKGEFI